MKRALTVAFCLTCAALAVEYYFGWSALFAELESFARRTANPLAFVAVMGIGCAIGLPLSAAYLYSGMAFGVFNGWILCLAGLLFSSAIGYAIGGLFLTCTQAQKLRSRAKIDSADNIYRLNFYVRAIPGIPYWVQNLILGSVHTKFGLYMCVNIAVQGAIGLAMNGIGATVGEGGNLKYYILTALVLCLIVAHRLMLFLCKRLSRKE